jgi:hypothetical protein
MNSIRDILPIKLNNKMIEYIKTYFVFSTNTSDNITPVNIIEILDSEIYNQLNYIIKNVRDLSDTNVENILKTIDLFQNILLLNNIDYTDYLNLRIRGLEKWLKISKKISSGTEGYVYKVNIVFRDLTSPDLVLKKTQTEHTSTELLKEFINYYIIGKLIDYTPNFISTLGLVVCNSNKSSINAENSQTLCSCVGTMNCVNKNYLINIPYKGETIEHYIKVNPLIIKENLSLILKQIAYSLKISQEKFKFTHNDLNEKNISLTVYSEPKKLSYIFENNTTIDIMSNIKVNIFDFDASTFSDISKLEQIDKKIFDYYNLKKKNINQYVFDETYDYKYLINKLHTKLSGEYYELEILSIHKQNISSVITMDEIINIIKDIDDTVDELLRPITKPPPITRIFPEQIKNLSVLTLDINNKLKKAVESIKLQDIKPIQDSYNNIDIDGYDSDKLFGPEPKFNYMMLAKSHDFYNMYGDIRNTKCKTDNEEKKIYWGNPGYSKFFSDDNPINWEDISPSELPHPTELNRYTSFTYAFVIDKYTKNISVRYGQIDNVTEIAGNHAIISYNDKIIVSGELGIKKLDSSYIYYININSSKMNPVNSKINYHNIKSNTSDTDNFYYILMINMALILFKAIEPSLEIRIAPGFNIKYGTQYEYRTSQGIKIVEYYDTIPCPNSETMLKYNEYGRKNKIKNACVGFEEAGQIQNIKKVDNILKCDWDDNDMTSKYYQKYLKYKNKYINLKKIMLNNVK